MLPESRDSSKEAAAVKTSRRKVALGGLVVFLLILLLSGITGWLLYKHYSFSTRGLREYDFLIARSTQVLDGRTLVVNTVNGHVRGPALHVNEGDTLSVKLRNALSDHGVSLHWHGLEMRGVQHYDGVVGLTQCAVAPGKEFIYRFVVDEEPGTYWWHTHSDMMPVGHDFIKGPLIIHQKGQILPGQEYQYDREMILFYQDLYPNYMGYDHPLAMGGLNNPAEPDVEGFAGGAIGWTSGLLNGESRHVVGVESGEYRLRIINGGGIFPYFFSVDGFQLTVVATDGSPVQPYQTDIIQVHTGERYDVLVNLTTTAPTHNVWIRAHTPSTKQDKGILGVLQIRGDPDAGFSDQDPVTAPANLTTSKLLNCVHFNKSAQCVPVTELKPLRQRELLQQETHVADFLFQFVPQYAHLFSLDHGTWKQNVLPHKAMLMDSFDPATDLHPNALVLSLPLNRSVTLVIRSVTAFPHPLHLHGHKFEVLEVASRQQETCPDARCDLVDLETVFSAGSVEQISRRAETGVLKDTVIVPSGGAVAIRFNTDNPGIWFIHCHLDQHMEDGQGFIIQEGNFKQTQFPPDYPSCNYTGRLQTLKTANCSCHEDVSLDERWRMKSSYMCSRPHLCRHTS